MVFVSKHGSWKKVGYALVLIAPLWLIAGLITGVAQIGKGKPVFVYNLLDLKRTVWDGPALSAGKHTIVFDFKSDGPGLGKGGTGILSVDGKEVAKNSMEHTTPITFPEDETFRRRRRHTLGRRAAAVSLREPVQVHRQD